MKLKVYFTASTSFNGENKATYKKIIDNLHKNNSILKSGNQIISDKLLDQDKKLSKKQIFEREKKLIDQADCIIAEVTKPSLGVGGEIVYGLTEKKPVLALVAQNHEDKISPMIAGNPSENLFLEFYNTDNLDYKIKNFLIHINNLKTRKGLLIVIDGGDGSGKTTQAHLLVDYLKKNNFPVKYFDFPQYYSSFHGKTVAKFLRGEFGQIDQVSPYLASLAFALDRVSVKQEMEDFLNKGGIIITNRYATSNMAHQAAKFIDKKQREEYLKWIYELEYKIHKLPKENIVIYLHVPWKFGQKLTKKKGVRDYLKGKSHDIAESNINHRIKSEEMYLKLVNNYSHWIKINCINNNQILPPEEIHQNIIYQLIRKGFLKFDKH